MPKGKPGRFRSEPAVAVVRGTGGGQRRRTWASMGGKGRRVPDGCLPARYGMEGPKRKVSMVPETPRCGTGAGRAGHERTWAAGELVPGAPDEWLSARAWDWMGEGDHGNEPHGRPLWFTHLLVA
jgi:hypothetical protein